MPSDSIDRNSQAYHKLSAEHRFWLSIDKNGPLHPVLKTRCWRWKAGITSSGYGALKSKRKLISAHRFSYIIRYGQIAEGMLVLHRCDNRYCCNPEHLFIGTQADNMADKVSKGRQAKGDRNGSRTHPERRAKGERQGSSKLTEEDVKNIKRLFNDGYSQAKLGKMFNVTASSIYAIVHGITWRHLNQ